MSGDQNIGQWLRKWFKGDPEATSALQGAAEKDRFLADALEGYERFPKDQQEERLARLQQRLTQRTTTSKRRGLIWYLPRIAAAASVLLVVSWMLNRTFTPTSSEVAMTPANTSSEAQSLPNESLSSLATDADSVIENRDITKPALRESGPPPSVSSESSPDQGASIRPLAKREKSKEKISTSPPLANSRITRAENTGTVAEMPPPVAAQMPTEPTSDFTAEEEMAFEAEPPPVLTESMAVDEPVNIPIDSNLADDGLAQIKEDIPARPLRKITGIITDEDTGEPLIGATILETGTSNGTQTDFDGEFTFEIQSDAKTIEVAYTGYGSTVVNLTDQNHVSVRMNGGLALDEVVVVSKKRKFQKANQTAAAQVLRSEKEKSWVKASRSFRRYVKKEQQYPQAAQENQITGEVRIEFYINAQGRPVNFRVTKSLGYGCDEEAIRLLENGPDWKKNRSGRFTFTF